jgi:hypothetical protein
MQLKNGSQDVITGLATIEPEPGVLIIRVVLASP